MSANPVSKLIKLIGEKGSKERIKSLEDIIIESINKFAKEEDFYKLPTEEILEIVERSNIEDVKFLCEIISKMSESNT